MSSTNGHSAGANSPRHLTDPSDLRKEIIDANDTFLFDCDGVVYRQSVPIEGVVDTIRKLREAGKKLIFISNNSRKSRQMYQKTFASMGIDAHIDEIFGSAYAAAIYLRDIIKFPADKKVYIIGEEGIEEELKEVGIQYCGGTDPSDREFIPSGDYSSIQDDPEVGCVLCGMDGYVCIKKYAKAHTYITQNEGCIFMCTNTDATFPAKGGRMYPGSGAMSAPLRTSTGREPIIVGKPHQHMMEAIKAVTNIDPSRTIIFGDVLATDIRFGQTAGLNTALVLTGVTKAEKVLGEERSTEIVPKFVVNSLGDLLHAF